MRYRSGLRVPQDGIYRVYHRQHRLPPEVTLLGGAEFPPCAKCGNLVEFELAREVSPLETARFHVTLYQLPVLENREATGAGANDHLDRDDGSGLKRTG